MLKTLKFLLLPFFLYSASKATYKAGWDIHFSPYAGGEDILFVHKAIERVEEYYLSKSSIPSSTTAAARFCRFTELYLAWLPVNYLAVIAQHEVFGHGYRIRDINRGKVQVAGYSLNAPPPYGSGGAVTKYNVSDSFTTIEESAIAIAGVESTAILAQLTKLKWIESRFVNPRQTVLYLLGQHDLNLYIGSLDVSDDEDLDGHDIHGYLKSLNYTYTKSSLSSKRLHSLSWINLADPFTYYSIYAWFRYILAGKETRFPMIPIFNWGYLPTARLSLTPFGPEVFIENYLVQGKKTIYFYLKGGEFSDNQYGGLGFFAPSFFLRGKWRLGFRCDLWRQPKLLLNPSIPFTEINFDEKPNPDSPLYSYSEQESKQFGGAASLLFGFSSKSGFEVELGYKTKGFLPGYSLRSAPTARLFYSLVF
jgi:hypothetical protein